MERSRPIPVVISLASPDLRQKVRCVLEQDPDITVVEETGAPADVYFGRVKEVLSRREEIKRKTLEARRRQHTQSLRMAA